MADIFEIHENKSLQSNELLDILIDVLNDNAQNMDYYAILGVIGELKTYIRDEMNE